MCAFCFRRQQEGSECFGNRLRLQHHAFTAAKGAVVDCTVAIVCKRPQIVRVHRHQTLRLRALHNAVLKNAGKKVRKDGENIEAHAQPSLTSFVAAAVFSSVRPAGRRMVIRFSATSTDTR